MEALKRLIKEVDDLMRAGKYTEAENERIHDLFMPFWRQLGPEEIAEAERYSIELYEKWSPKDHESYNSSK